MADLTPIPCTLSVDQLERINRALCIAEMMVAKVHNRGVAQGDDTKALRHTAEEMRACREMVQAAKLAQGGQL